MSQGRWERTRHGICSPILNGIGSDKGLTLHPPLRWILIKPPWRRMLLSSTVKPFRVALVEPVAYLSDSYMVNMLPEIDVGPTMSRFNRRPRASNHDKS